MLMLPSHILTAKVVPSGSEATIMGLPTTLMKFNNIILRNFLGVYINSITANVTKDDISNYWVLALIHLIGTCVPLLYVYCLIPSNKSIDIA